MMLDALLPPPWSSAGDPRFDGGAGDGETDDIAEPSGDVEGHEDDTTDPDDRDSIDIRWCWKFPWLRPRLWLRWAWLWR